MVKYKKKSYNFACANPDPNYSEEIEEVDDAIIATSRSDYLIQWTI